MGNPVNTRYKNFSCCEQNSTLYDQSFSNASNHDKYYRERITQIFGRLQQKESNWFYSFELAGNIRLIVDFVTI